MFDLFFKNPKLLTATELRLLLIFCELMSYNGNILVMSQELRQIILEKLGISYKSFNRALNGLEDKNLIKRRDIYIIVSTSFAAKGTEVDTFEADIVPWLLM